MRGTSYRLENNCLYTYGDSGFVIINLDNGNISCLFDDKTNEWFKTRMAILWSQTKRTKEGLNTPYITIIPSAQYLIQEQLEIREQLKNEYIKYPVQLIYSGS